MADITQNDFNINDQRYWNENTPPERIKAFPVPPKWKRCSPNVTMDSVENLTEKLEKIHFNVSDDGIGKESFKEKNDPIFGNGKSESFGTDDSFSMSSNGFASSSCVNDSSIFNASDDDHPESSTPHHSLLSSSKYKVFRPPDLVIEEVNEKRNLQEIDLAQFSPVRSPFPPNSANDSLFGNDETPQPLRFGTPPKGFYMKDSEMKMVHLLKRFGLSHFAFIFVEQEVDVELFLTLNDQDLKEIGIKRNTDRNVLLSVISECNTRLYGYTNEKR